MDPVKKMSEDYVEYLKTNTQTEMSSVEETIENLLMRLEEYSGTLQMIRSEREEVVNRCSTIVSLRSGLVELTNRIDAMEILISRVHQDMNTLETQLIEAEQDFPEQSKFKNILKPILSKISQESSEAGGMSRSTLGSYEKVDIIDTNKLFQDQNKN